MASVAMAETRAGSTPAALRSFWAKRSVALRPEPAAVGLISVEAVMVFSCVVADVVWCGWDDGGLPAGPDGPRRRLAASSSGEAGGIAFSDRGGSARAC